MKRYVSSFFITFIIYASVAAVLVYTLSDIKKDVPKNDEKKIMAVTHISLIQQEEKVLVKKVEKKIEKKPEKKIEKIVKKKTPPKVKLKPKPIKKIATKKVLKPKPKKIVQKKVKPKVIEPEIKVPKVVKKEPVLEAKKITKKIEISEQPAIKRVVQPSYQESFIAEHLEKIKHLIHKNVRYPRKAKKLNVQGMVMAQFHLSSNGKLVSIEILKGHRLLKKSTIKAIKEASKLFPKVEKAITIKVPVAYSLI